MADGLGYDPKQYGPAGAGAQTIEQWVADMATQYTTAFANGVTSAFDPFPELFSNTFWATLGFQPLPQESWGAVAKNPNNAVNPGVYTGLHQFFSAMAKNPSLAQSKGLTVPQLPTGGPVTDDLGRQHQYGAAQNALDREAQAALANANNAAALARQQAGDAAAMDRLRAQLGFEGAENEKNRLQQMAIVNLQESGMNSRQAQELANRMSIAQLQDAGESARNAARIAADLQIANQRDATERYGIDKSAEVAAADRTSRESIAGADRTSRENIAAADRQESGRQFDLRLGEDRRQFNSSMILELFDRGIQLAKNPVDWVAHQYYMANLNIPATLMNIASMANSLGAVPPTGPSSLGPMIGGPGAVDGDATAANAAGVQPRMVSLQEAMQANPGDRSNPVIAPVIAGGRFNLDSPEGLREMERVLAQARGEAYSEIGDNPVVQQAMAEASRALALNPPPSTGTGQPAVTPAAGLPRLPGQGQQQQQAAAPTGGIYTGAAGNQQPGSNPQAALLDELAKNLGVNPEVIQRLGGGNLLAGGYSTEVLNNSPVMQALRSGSSSMSQFHTGDASQTPFGTIKALGINTGVRGGQDINAGLLTRNNDSSIQAIRGAVEGQGLSWEDVVRQSLKAAPVSDFAVGAFGRRRN